MASYPAHFPSHLIDERQLPSGARLTLRPVLPADAPLFAELIHRAPPSMRYNRFSSATDPLDRSHLDQLACVDYRTHMALVVVHTDSAGNDELVAEARYRVTHPPTPSATAAPGPAIDSLSGCAAALELMVDPHWQGRGLGGRLLDVLQQAAAQANLAHLSYHAACYDDTLIALMKRQGFHRDVDASKNRRVQFRLALPNPTAEAASPIATRQPPAILRWSALRGRATPVWALFRT